jgi:hypothetical protein
VGTSNKDLSLAEVRQEMHRTISTALGVPELLISPTNAADLTPVKMAEKIFYNTTVLPRWRWYEEVLNAELLVEYPDLVSSGAKLQFDTSDIGALQEDEDSKAARLGMLVEKKIIKPAVAAIELGYKEEDVPEEPEPEPEPEPVMLQPMPPQFESEKQSEAQQMPPDVVEEMRRWQRKATNALKSGKSADVEFVSALIPPGTMASIRDALKICQSTDEITRVFVNEPAKFIPGGFPKGQATDYSDLVAELKAARLAMLNEPEPVKAQPQPITVNVTLPEIVINPQGATVNMPEQEVKVVNEIQPQPVPVVNVTNEITTPPPVVNVNLKPANLTSTVKRNNKGDITEVETHGD